jgi:hypothetical protein
MLSGERPAVRRSRLRARKLETIVSRCLDQEPNAAGNPLWSYRRSWRRFAAGAVD